MVQHDTVLLQCHCIMRDSIEAQPHAFIQRAKQLRDVAIKAKAAYIEHKLEHGC
jgi:hypothetical protein